ncbi:MAG TPA: serpin family protein [Ruminococcus sp.]|mgnify:FL=1|nr:serpin family protein [Ruminococcus sp.]
MKIKKIMAGLLSASLLCQPMISNAYYDYEKNNKTLAGDVNMDGRFNIADVITLQKYLIGEGYLENEKNADYYEDNVIDIFDLCLMQNDLIESLSIPSPLYKSRNLCANFQPDFVNTVEFEDEFLLGQTKFALDFLKHSLKENDNTLISPYSATHALAMTANGAKGETQKSIEKVLCDGVSIDKLNQYLYTQSQNEKPTSRYDTTVVNNANSIWIRPDIDVDPDFINKNVTYLGSQIFSSPMDRSTAEDVNQWVNNKTHEMIPSLLDPDIFEQTDRMAMLLVNALAFEGKWADEFSDAVDGKFTASDGKVQDAQMMHSDGKVYLCDDNATGFKKSYMGGYYFAALLPNEGITVDEYINGLDAEKLRSILTKPQYTSVNYTMPKFKFDDSISMKDMLEEMGMEPAFDKETADFTDMTTDDHKMFISDVLQKTHIEVDEKGTRAAAATVVLLADNTAMDPPEEPKNVILDRPFVFAIVDSNTDLPIFMGTVKNLSE